MKTISFEKLANICHAAADQYERDARVVEQGIRLRDQFLGQAEEAREIAEALEAGQFGVWFPDLIRYEVQS